MPFLLCHHSETTDRWTLSRETSPIRLGRSRDAEICLRDVGISKRHAEIVRRGPRWHVRDLGSRNGTLVNGFRVEGSSPLRDGDEITVGPVTIRFFLSEERAQAFAGGESKGAPQPSEPAGTNGEGAGSTEIAHDAPGASAGEANQATVARPDAKGARQARHEAARPLAARVAVDEVASDPADGTSNAQEGRIPLSADPDLEQTIRAIYERPRLTPRESPGPRQRDGRTHDRRGSLASRPEPSQSDAPPVSRRGRKAIAAILLFLAGFGLGRWTAPGTDPTERASPRVDEGSAQDRLARSLENVDSDVASTEGTPDAARGADSRGVPASTSIGRHPFTPTEGGATSGADVALNDGVDLERLLGAAFPAGDDAARARATLRLALDLLERPLLRAEVEKLPASMTERIDAIIAIVEESRGTLSINTVLDAVIGDRLPETSRGEIGAATYAGARELLAKIGRSTFYAGDSSTRSRNSSQRAASLWVDLLELSPTPENVDAVARALVETGLSEVVRMLLYSSKSRLRGPAPGDLEAARNWVRAEYLRFAGRQPTPSEEERAIEEIGRAEQGWRYVIQDLATRPEYERY